MSLSTLDQDDLVEQIVDAGGAEQWSRQTGRAGRTVRDHLVRCGLRARVDAGLALKALAAAGIAEEVSAIRQEARSIQDQVSKVKTGEQRAKTEVNGDKATVVTRPAPNLGDPVEWIRGAGLDPEEWEIGAIRLNSWDGMTSDKATGDNRALTLYQVRADLKRKVPVSFLFPATDVEQRWRPTLRQTKGTSEDPHDPRPEFVVFLPDPHCPYNDPELDKRVNEFLHRHQPDRVVSPGDVCDFSSISRHRDNTAWMSTAQENIQAGFEWWASKRDAAPDARMDFLEGNHDFRIRGELLTRAERMYGIKPAQVPGAEEEHDALSMRRLLHLDRLRVNFVGPPLEGDNYFHGHLDLAPDLCVRHGWLTGANSASGTLSKLGMSTFFGHTHHQRVHHKTLYKGAEPIGEIVGIECGTLALIRGGLGYTANPDWQQGFATATIWPDGTFTYDLARYDGKRLVWRNERI